MGGQTQVANERTVVANEPSFDVPSFEISAESAYLLGIIGNPNSYEIGAEFLTARWRWGVNDNDRSLFRGYNQVYFLAMAEPIFRGPRTTTSAFRLVSGTTSCVPDGVLFLTFQAVSASVGSIA